MDKIKILAAALALAGCMENGIGMEVQEDMHMKNDKEIYSHITIKENDLYILSAYVSDLDFTNEYVWERAIEKFKKAINITFDNCIFNQECIDFFPSCHNATQVSFVHCIGVNNSNYWRLKSAARCAEINFK